MNGQVDEAGRALIVLLARSSQGVAPTPLTAWIDTAFTGELVVPRDAIGDMGLSQSAAVMAGLADGTQVVLETFSCVIEWFGQMRTVEVVANDGQYPLLGVALLQDRKLTVDYRALSLAIE